MRSMTIRSDWGEPGKSPANATAIVQPTSAPHTVTISFRQRRVLTDIARIFSTVCNPFVTAIALYVILAHSYAKDTATFWTWLFVATFWAAIGPMLCVLWLYRTGRISDLDMSVRPEREAVYSIFVTSYLLGTVTLYCIHAPPLLIASMATYTAASFIAQA